MHYQPRHLVRSSLAVIALSAFVSTSAIASTASAEENHTNGTVAFGAPAAAGLDSFNSDALTPTSMDEFSNTYSLGGGLNVTEVSAEPLHIKNSSGKWTDVETFVSKDPAGGGMVKNNPLSPEFAANADDDKVLALSDDKYELSFSLDNAASSPFARSVKPSRESPVADVVYRDVFDGVDLTYDVKPGSVKETLVLDAPPVPDDSAWTWDIHAAGLTLVKDSEGDLRFLDRDQEVRFTIPAPTMWDSSGIEGVREPAERLVETTVTNKGNGHWGLTLSANHEWLSSSDRVYPVYVDPTALYGDINFKSYRSDGLTSSQSFRVGNSRDNNTNTYWRNLVKFDYDEEFGQQIIGGKMTVTANTGDTALRRGSVNTASCRGYDCVGTRLDYMDIDTSGVTSSEDVPAAFSDWVLNEVPGHAIVMRGAETPGVYTYKTVTPKLQLIWKNFPAIMGRLAPSPDYASTTSTRPSFTAIVRAMPDTEPVVQFRVSTSTNPAVPAVFTSDWMSPDTLRMPDGVLAPNTQYYWNASIKDASDGVFGVTTVRPSPTYVFTTSAAAPTAPVALNVVPISGAAVGTTGLTPTVTALSADADGGIVSTRFEAFTVEDIAHLTPRASCEASAISGSTSSCSLSPALTTDTEYIVRASSTDGSSESDWVETPVLLSTDDVPEAGADDDTASASTETHMNPDCMIAVQGIIAAGGTDVSTGMCAMTVDSAVTAGEEVSDGELASAKSQLSTSDYDALAASAAAGKLKKKSYVQSMNSITDKVEQNGVFYYDGSRAWVTNKYRGITGTHKCKIDWAVVPVSVQNTDCSESGGRKSRDLAMAWHFTVGIKYIGVSWDEDYSMRVTNKGKITYTW